MLAPARRALVAIALLCVVSLAAAQSRAPLVANLTVTLSLTANLDSPTTPRTIGTNLGA